jgi:hypothetical protein
VLPYSYFKGVSENLYGFDIYSPEDRIDDKELILDVLKDFVKNGVVPDWLIRENPGGRTREVYNEITQEFGGIRLNYVVALDCVFDPPAFDFSPP